MSSAADPLAPLASLPGVQDAVDSARGQVDRIYGHRIMRRRSGEVSAEAALRGARGSAALAGADWALEELRRRTDFGASGGPRTVGAALRLTAEAGQLLDVWRQSPLRVLARLHLVAAGGPSEAAEGATGGATGGSAPDAAVGRPRLAGEAVAEEAAGEAGPVGPGGEPPDTEEVSGRLDGLAELVVAGTQAPALVLAAVVHGELATLRPFASYNAQVARAAERVVLVGGGLDPKSVCPPEVGHAELGRAAYGEGLEGYASGTPEGMARWITHCGRAVELGARESTAVCEAMQRGAA